MCETNTSSTSRPRAKKEPPVWNCSLCDQTFKWRRHYNKHTEGHKINDCHLCNEPLTTKRQHVVHMAQKHQIIIPEKSYKCEYCEQLFKKKPTLYNHYKQDHADGLIVCMRCGMFLKTEEEEFLHEKRHEQERRWKCKMCGDTFSRRQQYGMHLQGHEKYGCDICDISFATKLRLMDHNRDVHNDQSLELCHKCTTCGQRFSRPSHLAEHICSHSDEQPFYCKSCNKNFRTSKGYQKHFQSSAHLESTSLEDRKKYKCDKCKCKFLKKDSLIKHLQSPHSYKCEFCDFTSNSKENTKRHLALHTTSRQFICELCGVAFFTFGALNEHFVYVHSQLRQFQCDKCDQSFKTNRSLTRHLQAHSDVRPHACHCGQSYKRLAHLRRHQNASHGPVPKQNKIQRMGRDENGSLVPVVEAPKTSKKEKKNNESVWCPDTMKTLVIGESGQVITIEQIGELPSSSLDVNEPVTYNTGVMQSYNLSFTSPNDPQSQLVFTKLESSGMLENMLQSDLAVKHPNLFYLQPEEVGNVMVVSNNAAVSDACFVDSQQSLDPGFSGHEIGSDLMVVAMSHEEQSQECNYTVFT